MILRYCKFLFTLAFALMCAACGELPTIGSPAPTIDVAPTSVPASERLIGHWKNPETGYIMSFYQEGTVTYESPCGLNIGDYHFLEQNLIRINWQSQYESPGYSQVLEIKLEDDTLTLNRSPKTPVITLARVPNRQPEVASTPCSDPPS